MRNSKARQAPKVRRSQLLSTFGIGGLFPAQSTSFMIRGLDDWPADRDGLVISEPRLARSLGVRELRLPPAGGTRDIPVIRFPATQVCPKCHRIGNARDFGAAWNESVCRLHSGRTELGPFRLLVCCSNGHIDEFPIFRWLHGGTQSAGSSHEMKLMAAGVSSSLGDMRLSCSCGAPEIGLDGAFDPSALKELIRCSGRRPWLNSSPEEECDELPRTVQRGASNVWFPSVRSAISIPPFSDAIAKFVDRHWRFLKDPVALDTPQVMNPIVEDAKGRFSMAEIIAEARRRHQTDEQDEIDDARIRIDEFDALVDGRPDGDANSDFVALQVDAPEKYQGFIGAVRQVTRLREVRALHGFSRLSPLTGEKDRDRMCALSVESPVWYPAIEVIGEGIFLRFDSEALGAWASQEWVARRMGLLRRSALRAAARRRNEGDLDIDAVRVAIHTFSHVLIDQLSLDAGYPAASIRERLYVHPEAVGLLVYTASSDSAGSLGGLAAHAATDRLTQALDLGLERLQWCSSDPVCIETTSGGTDGLNLAACHACVLLPETSCELNNTFLDRALLFGTPDGEGRGGGVLSDLVLPMSESDG